jgi:hypothetical protein
MVKLLRPYEMCFMFLAVLLGFGYSTAAPAPTSVLATMSRPIVVIWALALLLSGLVGLVSCAAGSMAELRLVSVMAQVPRGPFDVARRAWRLRWWLEIERAAEAVQVGALGLITSALIQAWWTHRPVPFPLLGVGFCLAWAVADVWRTLQIASTIIEAEALTKVRISPDPEE